MGQHTEAYYYAKRHLEISRDTGDRMGQATAQLNLTDLCRTLGYTPPEINELPHEKNIEAEAAGMATTSSSELKKSRRSSMEHMDLIKMTPDPKKVHAKTSEDKENNSSLNKSGLLDEEDFFDFITRFQSKRMDDQRCSLTVPSMKGMYIYLLTTYSSARNSDLGFWKLHDVVTRVEGKLNKEFLLFIAKFIYIWLGIFQSGAHTKGVAELW